MIIRISFFFILLSAAIKILAILFTDFNLFGDEAQYWIWSKNLNTGYYSKPPLLMWVIGGITFFFGNSFWVLKMIPMIVYLITGYVIFLLSLQIYKKKDFAIIAGASFYLMPAVSFSSFLISTDVVLILFWSLSLLFLLKIRSNPVLINFLLLGIFLGLSFLAKYAAVYFILSLIIIMFLDTKTKDVFFKNIFNFWVFLLSFLLILLPNIIWNVQNSWVTFSHTSDNAGLDRAGLHLFQGIEFILAQLGMIGPVLVIGFLFKLKKVRFKFEDKFLLSFSLPIFLIVFIESIVVRANANWAAVGFVSMLIFLLNYVFKYSKKIIILNNFLNFSFGFILFILIALSSNVKVFNRVNGLEEFSNILYNEYLKNNEYIVVEDRLLYSSLRYSMRKTTMKFLTTYSPNQQIKSHFHISDPLKPQFNKSFIFIGSPESLNYLNNQKKIKKIKSFDVKFQTRPIEIYEVIF